MLIGVFEFWHLFFSYDFFGGWTVILIMYYLLFLLDVGDGSVYFASVIFIVVNIGVFFDFFGFGFWFGFAAGFGFFGFFFMRGILGRVVEFL